MIDARIWAYIATASITVLGTCAHLIMYWVNSKSTPTRGYIADNRNYPDDDNSVGTANPLASVKMSTTIHGNTHEPCVVDLSELALDTATIIWAEIQQQMSTFTHDVLDKAVRVLMPTAYLSESQCTHTQYEYVAPFYVLRVRLISQNEHRPQIVNVKPATVELCVFVGAQEITKALVRDVVRVRIMPRLMRLVPCYTSEMCGAIVRVVRGFLRPTEDEQDPLFVDVLPLLSNPRAFSWLVNQGVQFVRALDTCETQGNRNKITAIVALETRGFMFGVSLATAMGLSFIPLRRPGKYPGRLVIRQKYTKASGSDAMELDGAVLGEGEHVVVVDDLLASGASLLAASRVIRGAEGHVRGSFVPIEIVKSRGRMNLWKYQAHWPVHTIVQMNNLAEASRIDDIRDSVTIVDSKTPSL